MTITFTQGCSGRGVVLEIDGRETRPVFAETPAGLAMVCKIANPQVKWQPFGHALQVEAFNVRAIQGAECVAITTTTSYLGDPDCHWCNGSRFVAGKRPRMDGTAKVRQGKRLLAALEGQPSECYGCEGHGETGPGLAMNASTRVRRVAVEGMLVIGEDGEPREAALGEVVRGPCPDCEGSGRNIAWVLSALEWSAVVRRKVVDGWDAVRGTEREPAEWSFRAFGEGVHYPADRIRSVPRGQHRGLESGDMVAASDRCTTNAIEATITPRIHALNVSATFTLADD